MSKIKSLLAFILTFLFLTVGVTSPVHAAPYLPISCVNGTTIYEPLTLTYDTTKLTSSTLITVPLAQISGSITVDWGDGTVGTFTTAGNQSHSYASSGTYTVQVCGSVLTFGSTTQIAPIAAVPGAAALVAVNKFGGGGLVALNGSFSGATNLTSVPTTLPSTVQFLFDTFEGATSFNDPNVESWNTAGVKSTSTLFSGASSFNRDLGSWNLVSDLNLGGMFFNASAYNNNGSSSINNWNVSNAVNMAQTFQGASVFNQPIGNWNVGKVVRMSSMFAYATVFNQPIGSWNTASVFATDNMFLSDRAFNQDIGGVEHQCPGKSDCYVPRYYVQQWRFTINQQLEHRKRYNS